MASGITNDPTLRNSQILQGFGTTTTGDVQALQKKTGTGGINGAGQAPDAPAAGTMSAVLASVFEMVPQMTGQMLDVLLLEVTTKMKDTIDKSEKGKIETDTAAKRVQIGEKQAKMEEATKKIQEAEDKLKNMSVWDKIKLAFQYIGAILSIIAGVVAMIAGAAAIATGVGSVAGALSIGGGVALITSGLMMLYMAADATYAAVDKDGLGFVGRGVKDRALADGATEQEASEKAGDADMAARVAIGAVAAFLAIAGSIAAMPLAFVSGGAAAGGLAATGVKIANTATGIIGGLSQMSTSAGDLTVGILRNEANQEKSDGLAKKAEAKQMEALIQSMDEMIDLAMARLKGAGERFDGMLDSLTDAIKDRSDSLSRVGLRA